MYAFTQRTTSDLSAHERTQIRELYEQVFKVPKTVEAFERQFLGTCLGTSYHGLMHEEDGRIVGCQSAIPYRYTCDGRPELFALSVDTMIHPAHRQGPFSLKRMADLVCETLARDGVTLIYGIPNANSYAYMSKILKWTQIGELAYYVLPLRFPRLGWVANPLNRLVQALYLGLIGRWPTTAGKPARIVKIADDQFARQRYGPEHHTEKVKGGQFVWTRHRETVGHVAYIIDVQPLERDILTQAVQFLRHTACDCDLLAYVGWLPFAPLCLFRLPAAVTPRHLPLLAKPLGATAPDGWDILAHWSVNLSNFDMR